MHLNPIMSGVVIVSSVASIGAPARAVCTCAAASVADARAHVVCMYVCVCVYVCMCVCVYVCMYTYLGYI